MHWYSRHLCLITLGGASAKVCSSAKFGIVIFKASILNSEVGPSAKECFSAKCCVLVFKVSMLYLWGVHLPKCVCLPSVVYWYSRHLCSICGQSIWQSNFVWQVMCTGIQGIYALFMWGVHLPKCVCLPSVVYWYSRHLCSICGQSIWQSNFVWQVMCTGIQGIYALFMWGVHLPKCVCLPSVVYWYSTPLCSICGQSIWQSNFVWQVMCTGIQGIYALFMWGVHQPK